MDLKRICTLYCVCNFSHKIHVDPSMLNQAYYTDVPDCLRDMNGWCSPFYVGCFTYEKMFEYRLHIFRFCFVYVSRNLDVIFDLDLDFETHIKNIIKTYFYHLNIAKVQPFLAQADTERLMHAFITSRLDYCITRFCLVYQKKPLVNYKQYRMQQRESSLKQDGERTSHQY